MWLILCDDLDASALWVYEGLRARGAAAELVSASVLSGAVRWVHRVGPDGAAAEVLLPDGRCIDTTAVRGTLNRMTGLWPQSASTASPDGDYALQELLALYLSLLRCLSPPMLNRPSAQGLSGRMRCPIEWFVLAARAGFATLPYEVSSGDEGHPRETQASPALADAVRQEILVAAGRVFGHAVSPRAATAVSQLAGLADVELLAVRVATTGDGAVWFEAADLYPDLRLGGDELLDHLAALTAPADVQ